MVLTTLIDITGAAGWAAILAPYFILAVVGMAALAGRDASAPSKPPAAMVSSEPAVSAMPPAAAPAPGAEPRTLPAPVLRETQPRERPVTIPWAVPAPAPSPAGPGAASALEAMLADAEQRFDDAAVARLSLELARRSLADGQPDSSAATHLRRAIILASRLGDQETHAAARLELGDLVAGQGDMTTACEHWQIARQIFWDGGETEMLAEADRRMIANGCPTDWVLNDF